MSLFDADGKQCLLNTPESKAGLKTLADLRPLIVLNRPETYPLSVGLRYFVVNPVTTCRRTTG